MLPGHVPQRHDASGIHGQAVAEHGAVASQGSRGGGPEERLGREGDDQEARRVGAAHASGRHHAQARQPEGTTPEAGEALVPEPQRHCQEAEQVRGEVQARL